MFHVRFSAMAFISVLVGLPLAESAEKETSTGAITLKATQLHNGVVTIVRFSPDGRTIASGGDDAKIRLWAWKEKGLPRTLSCSGGVRDLAFSPDGRTVAASGWKASIELWDMQKGALRNRLINGTEADPHAFGPIAYLRNGKTLAAVRGCSILFFNVKNATIRKIYGIAKPDFFCKPFHSMAISPNGNVIATGRTDGLMMLLATRRQKLLFRCGNRATNDFGPGNCPSVVFSPTGEFAAVGGGIIDPMKLGSTGVTMWSVKTGKMTAAFETTASVYSVAISPDGSLLAAAASSRIEIWDVKNRKRKRIVENCDNTVFSLAWSPDGKVLASGGSSGVVKLWDVATLR